MTDPPAMSEIAMTDPENARPPRPAQQAAGALRSRDHYQGSRGPRNVTPATERMRRMRARKKAATSTTAPLLFERQDWQLFLRPENLPQKAGCEPGQIGRIILKELVDNALDTGSDGVTIDEIPGGYRVTDHGSGIHPADVPKLFAVDRPLLSSKLKRLPLRGMLGNGLRVVMGAVAACDGTITVTSCGRRQVLAIDNITGETRVASDTLTRPADGTTVEITLPKFTGDELAPAQLALVTARGGSHYTGPSQPAWYGPEDLRELFARVQPPTTTVARFGRDATPCATRWPRRRPPASCRAICSARSANSLPSAPSFRGIGRWRRCCVSDNGPILGESVPEDAQGHALGLVPPRVAASRFRRSGAPAHGLDDAPGGLNTGASSFRRHSFAGHGWTCRRRRVDA
jgi:Histidine kinase-, DNA gyrase B-, and HSP90-like ATPase